MGANNHFSDEYRDTDGIRRVVEQGLCHRCGSCVGLCPVDTYTTDESGYPRAVRDCIHCNICVRVCSGLAVDYPRIGQAIFGPSYQFGSPMGQVKAAYIAYAADGTVRTAGASGGVVSGLLIHWLNTERIRGALIAVTDPADPSKGSGFIARSSEDVLRGSQSRYTTTPSFAVLNTIKDEEGPFAVVGLPCQIHALRQRQLMDPGWLARVPIVIGLYCHYNLGCEASRLVARAMTPRGKTVSNVRYRERDARGWPYNTLQLAFSDGSDWRSPYGPAQTFNVISRVAKLGRCLMCLDAMAEFSDFSLGDPWIRDAAGEWKYHDNAGCSSILSRTAMSEVLLKEAVEAGVLIIRSIPPEEIYEGQYAMITEKKERVSFRLRLRRQLGLPVPRYPMPLIRCSREQMVKEIAYWPSRIVSALPLLPSVLLKLGFSPLGGYFVRRRMEKRRRLAAKRSIRQMSSSDVDDGS